jgi:hypothetical protein
MLLGFLAGLHAACYGAYKDSPFERFKIIRYLREIALATSLAVIFFILFPFIYSQSFTIFFLVVLAWSRIITEVYKLFIRVEPQDNYLIPSQVHFFRTVVQKKSLRLLLALFAGLILLIIYLFAKVTSNLFSNNISGLFIGALSGIATAFGGGYKDGLFQGFLLLKFFRSPFFGAIGGFLLSNFTNSLPLLFFGAIGFERMISECYKGFLKSGYSPGKFNLKTAPHPEYFQKRKFLIGPYVVTWIVFISLFIYEYINLSF